MSRLQIETTRAVLGDGRRYFTTMHPPYLKVKLMRIFILAVVSIIAFSKPVIAQVENPFADVLKTPVEIKVTDSDDRHAALLKQSFNAAHKEMRIRYNYWIQDVGEIDGLLNSIDRLHKIQLEIDPATSELAVVQWKLAFAKEIETQCEKESSKAKYEAIRQINEASAKAFRIRTELDLVKLELDDTSLTEK